MIQGQLLAYAVLALAQRGNATPNRRHMLAQAEVEAFHEGRIDLPAARGQPLLDRLERAEHNAVRHAHQAPPAYRLDHLRIQQPRQGPPARLGRWPFVLAARWLDPLALVR